MHDEAFPLPKVFGITQGWKLFLLICPLVTIFMGAGSFLLLQEALYEDKQFFLVVYHMVFAVLGLVMTPFLLWLAFDYYKSRLEISAAGLTYYGLGFRVYTPWQNILLLEKNVQLVPMTVSWDSKLVGFRLRQEAVMGMKLEEGRRLGKAVVETDWWYPLSMRRPYASFFIIDEIVRERNWLQRELGAYLFHYAPQAFVAL